MYSSLLIMPDDLVYKQAKGKGKSKQNRSNNSISNKSKTKNTTKNKNINSTRHQTSNTAQQQTASINKQTTNNTRSQQQPAKKHNNINPIITTNYSLFRQTAMKRMTTNVFNKNFIHIANINFKPKGEFNYL